MDTNNTQPRPNKKMGKPKFSFGWFYVALIFILFGGALFSGNMGGKEVPFSQFEQYLQKGAKGLCGIGNSVHQFQTYGVPHYQGLG